MTALGQVSGGQAKTIMALLEHGTVPAAAEAEEAAETDQE